MKLPNAQHAVVELEKLVDYCLNPEHERGKHKARVFAAACGIEAPHAELLRQALLGAAVQAEATLTFSDRFGARYVVEFTVQGPTGSALVRSSWIVRSSEDFPRLTSCYVV